MELLQNLNPEQQDIVTHGDGPIIIIAGPGTGKTSTLTARIAYLITKRKVDPTTILSLTFTKKAATEMQERITRNLLHALSLPTMTTFHGFAYNLLSAQNPITIIDETQRLRLIDSIRKSLKSPLSTRDASLLITNWKNQIAPIENSLVLAYNESLKNRATTDYDDLLLQTYQYLLRNPTVGQQYHYILIDEFQDTNNLQYAIIKLLLASHQNIFVIGDPHQSIYKFRGAAFDIFDRMEKDFPDVQTFQLTQNYRSDQAIVTISNQLFPEVCLTSQTQNRGQIQYVTTANAFTEADWIIRKIGRAIGGTTLLNAEHREIEQPIKFSDFAIIYRTHHIATTIEQQLGESGLPFQKIGSDSPYQTKMIRFIVCILKFIADSSNQSLRAIISSPQFRLSADTIDKIRSYEELINACDSQNIPAQERSTLVMLHNNMQKISEQHSQPLSKLIMAIVDLWQFHQNHKEGPQKDLQQFISTVIQFDQDKNGLFRFLDYYDYLASHEFYDPIADKMTLVTMHAAKGLEFSIVFIIGFDDGVIPLSQDGQSFVNDTVDDIGEEKRLFYVAITRAKNELYLTHALKRGKRQTTPSRFLADIKAETLPQVTDDAMTKLMKKKAAWKKKHAQQSLFD